MTVDKDVYAGAFFVLLGALGLWIGADYAPGTAARMGAGFLPKLLCWALLGMGALITATGLMRQSDAMDRWQLRPLIAVLAGVLVFAALIEMAGLVPTTLCMALVAAAGSQETRWLETAVATVVLAAASALVFVKGLGMTMKILPGVL